MESVGTLSSIASQRARRVVDAAKGGLHNFLGMIDMRLKSSEAKRKLTSPDDQNYIEKFTRAISDGGNNIKSIQVAFDEQPPSFLQNSRVLRRIDQSVRQQAINIFNAQIADLDTRFPVAKTEEANTYINFALNTIALTTDEATALPDMIEMQKAARAFVTKLSIKDPSKAANTGLSVNFRRDAMKILLAQNQTDYLKALTSFSKQARIQELDIHSSEFKTRLGTELGGGVSGNLLAQHVIARAENMMKLDISHIVPDLVELDPANSNLETVFKEFQAEQALQFRSSLIRTSFDRETAPKGDHLDSVAAQIQNNFNDKVHAWGNVLRASYNDASAGVDEITDLITAYNESAGLENQYQILLHGSTDPKFAKDEGITNQLNRLQSHNASPRRTHSSESVVVRKEFLTIDAKQAVLNRMAAKLYAARDNLATNRKTFTVDEVIARLEHMKAMAADGTNVRYELAKDTFIKIPKGEMDRVIARDLTPISNIEIINSSGSRTVSLTGSVLFNRIHQDILARENEKINQVLNSQDETIKTLQFYGGTDLTSTQAALAGLNEAQMDKILDQLGAFNLEINPDDQAAVAGGRSFARLLEASFREKKTEIKGAYKFIERMNAKANEIINRSIRQNPVLVNKLFTMYKSKGEDFNFTDMLVDHNIRDLAFGVFQSEIAGNESRDEYVLNARNLGYSELAQSINDLRANTNYFINGVYDIDPTLWNDFFGPNIDEPLDTSEFSTSIAPEDRNDLLKKYHRRLEIAANNPLARTDLIALAQKELFLEARGAMLASRDLSATLRTKYDAVTVPSDNDIVDFASEVEALARKLETHKTDMEERFHLRTEFYNRIDVDNVGENSLLFDKHDSLESAEVGAYGPLLQRLMSIFKPIVNVFVDVNRDSPQMQSAFAESVNSSSNTPLGDRAEMAFKVVMTEILGDGADAFLEPDFYSRQRSLPQGS